MNISNFVFLTNIKDEQPVLLLQLIKLMLENGCSYNKAKRLGDGYFSRNKFHLEEEVGDSSGQKLAKALDFIKNNSESGIKLHYIFNEEPLSKYDTLYMGFALQTGRFIDTKVSRADLLQVRLIIGDDVYLYLQTDKEHKRNMLKYTELAEIIYEFLNPVMAYFADIELDEESQHLIAIEYFFSPKMVETIGREKLLNVPWYKIKNLSDGGLQCWTKAQFNDGDNIDKYNSILKYLGDLNHKKFVEIAYSIIDRDDK